jgi:hypothetical protein
MLEIFALQRGQRLISENLPPFKVAIANEGVNFRHEKIMACY